MLKSGFVGAFALSGFLGFFAIAFSRSQNVSSMIEGAFKIMPSIPGLFATIGGLGFLLGLALRHRFPIIQKGFIPLIVAFVMLAVPMGFLAWFLHTVSMNIQLPPLSIKLAECTNNPVSIHLKIPRGHGYRLDLITSDGQTTPNSPASSSYKFSGQIRILSGGVLITNLSIGSDKAWISGSAFALTGVGSQNTNVPPLNQFIQAQKDYDFEISFDPQPPPSSSIWFYCMVSGKDKR